MKNFDPVLLHVCADGKPLFACIGTVVNHVGSETWILTSATLVRKPGADHDAYKADEVKVSVTADLFDVLTSLMCWESWISRL